MPKALLSTCLILLTALSTLLYAQNAQEPGTAQGLSPYAIYKAGNIDNINPANGNLFLQIPLLSYPQLGSALRLSFNIYYNDKQWYVSGLNTTINPNSGNPPTQTWNGAWSWYNYGNEAQPNNIGVYVARDQHLDFGYDQNIEHNSGGSNATAYTVTTTLYGYFVRGPDGGAKHYYADLQQQTCSGISGSNCPAMYTGYGSSYPTTDGSGYNPVGSAIYGASQILGPDGETYGKNYLD
jgi:hypothetical protein